MGRGKPGASQASTHTRLKFQPSTTPGARCPGEDHPFNSQCPHQLSLLMSGAPSGRRYNNLRTKLTLKDCKLALGIALEAAQFLLPFWVIFNFSYTWDVVESNHYCCLISIAYHHCLKEGENKRSHWKLNIYTPTDINPSRSKGGKFILKNIFNYFPILKGVIW